VFLILPIAYFGAVGGLLLVGSVLVEWPRSGPEANQIIALLLLLAAFCWAGRYTRRLVLAQDDRT
jgi:drug/metabolite transporter (DMT)-like permease